MSVYTYITLFPVGIRQSAGIWYKLTVHSLGYKHVICVHRVKNMSVFPPLFFNMLNIQLVILLIKIG